MSRVIALVACVFALLNGLCIARETMDERARSIRHRRSELMTPARRSPLERRDNSTWRFLNDKSQAYAVTSLPDIDFDLGEMVCIYVLQLATNFLTELLVRWTNPNWK
jgi:hypothetical protein